jgi:hypothetical protein
MYYMYVQVSICVKKTAISIVRSQTVQRLSTPNVFVLKKVSAQICNFFQFLSLFLLQFAAALFSRANKTTPVRFENV